MNSLKYVSALSFCVLLAACESDRVVGVVQPGFGDAVQRNVAGETVNPSAPANRAPLTLNGERAALQQKRYLTDTVEKPAIVGTLSSSVSGGNGGAGGSSGGGSAGGASAGAVGGVAP